MECSNNASSISSAANNPIVLAWCACTHTLENHPQKPVDGSHSLSLQPTGPSCQVPPGRLAPPPGARGWPRPRLRALRLRAGAPGRWPAPLRGIQKQSEVRSPFLSLRLSSCVPSPSSNCTICYSRNRCCVSPEVSSLPVSHLAGLLSQLVCFQLHEEDSSSLPSPKFSIRVGASDEMCVCVFGT